MAQQLVFAVTGISYGTPTGSNTMPSLTALPDTVKGSVSIDESEGTFTSFFTDQKKAPIKRVKTEEGEMTITAQFYDLDYVNLNMFKGAAVSGVTSKFAIGTDYTTIEKAIQISFDSGHKLKIYNGGCSARIVGGGGRDKMIAWELKITPQVTADNAGIYELTSS